MADVLFAPPAPRIISMVPSWTETLIEADFHVVGLTRFCIHPAPIVRKIPAVGGTKDIDWEKISHLNATHIILDKDENPQSFYWDAIARGLIPVVTHVQGLRSAALGLETIANSFAGSASSEKLNEWAQEFRIFEKGQEAAVSPPPRDIAQLWIKKPSAEITTTLYLIWKKPWMTVSRHTFIGEVLNYCGQTLPHFEQHYPEIDLKNYEPEKTLLLLSTEPFPFAKIAATDQELLAFPRAVVDGEKLSWFGIRSLKFLRSLP